MQYLNSFFNQQKRKTIMWPPFMFYTNTSTTTAQYLGMLITALILFTTIILYATINNMIIAFQRRPKSSSARKNLPKGSLGLPLIGETVPFISSALSDRPETFMNKRRALYGKVFKSHIFGSATIVSTDAEVSRVILQSDAKAFVPSYPKSLTELMGKSSILLMTGSLQRRIHGLVGSFFKSPHLKAQVTEDMQHYVKQSMARWSSTTQFDHHHPIYLQDESKHIAFQVLVKTLISLEPGQDMEFLKHQFREFIAGLMSLPVNLPGTRLHRSLQAKRKMVKLVMKTIQERRMNSKTSTQVPKDVMDVLLMNDSSEEFTDELIAGNMIDMMIPGEDSVPLLITLAVKYLSDCPTARQQLTEENMKMKRLKAQLGEPLQWTDYLSLPFTQSVIIETLRMGNIIIGVMRKAVNDVEIKGYFIPKGWSIFIYFRSIHLDDSLYNCPHQFNPWRWKDKDMMNGCNFTPFGGGQRLCPGLDLAKLEASIFLHHFVTEFSWVAEEDSIINFPTVRMKKRMPVWVKRIVDH